jgi:hypothetical protein
MLGKHNKKRISTVRKVVKSLAVIDPKPKFNRIYHIICTINCNRPATKIPQHKKVTGSLKYKHNKSVNINTMLSSTGASAGIKN